MSAVAGQAVRITVSGRLSTQLVASLGMLDAEVVPRHTVLVTPAGDTTALLTLLEELEQRGIQVDRVVPRCTRSG